MPDILKLRRTTPGSDPKRSEAPKSAHNPARKRKEYRRRDKFRVEEATKIKIDAPQPYDGSSDFNAFERWTYAVNTWFEITEFPQHHRV